MTVMNLDQLEVWKRACDFAAFVFVISREDLSQKSKAICLSKQGEKDYPRDYKIREETEIYNTDIFEDSDH